jgi:4'-phosphopantetheinyl transferase EntD
MDLSEVIRSLPSHVSLIALDGSNEGDFEIFTDEERLLPATASPLRAAEFRLGRRAAHLALREIGFEPQPILRGSQREPIWPPGVAGSITHAGSHALAAAALLSDVGGIGIDLEDRGRFFPALETEIAGKEELAALGRMEGRAREDATIELFSAKESIFKAHYHRIGHFFGFDAARIEFGPDHLVGYFTETLDPLYPVDRPMEIGRLWLDDRVLTWLVLPPD